MRPSGAIDLAVWERSASGVVRRQVVELDATADGPREGSARRGQRHVVVAPVDNAGVWPGVLVLGGGATGPWLLTDSSDAVRRLDGGLDRLARALAVRGPWQRCDPVGCVRLIGS